MGWNVCLATDSDRIKVSYLASLSDAATDENYEAARKEIVSLSRSFSDELFRDDGPLRKCITDDDIELLELSDIEDPDCWKRQEPETLLTIFYKIREFLIQESARMPVNHFLSSVDEAGERWGDATVITLPFDDIELKVPHKPIKKIDGGHRDLSHRNELRVYDIRIDPDLLTQYNREMNELLSKQNLTNSQQGFIVYGNSVKTNPIVEEPMGWIPLKPVLNVLGCRVEVESIDASALLCSDLNEGIEYCKQLISRDSPIYLLIE